MVTDMRLSSEIVVCPIVRGADGLALSSRNIYLSPTERQQALVLSRSVRAVESLYAEGERRAAVLLAASFRNRTRNPHRLHRNRRLVHTVAR